MSNYKHGERSKSKKSPKLKYEIGSGNVFRDMGFSSAEANKKLLKCQLAIAIEYIIQANGWTQAQAAKKLGIVQPRISEIMSTRVHRFTLDTLIKYLNQLGKEVHLMVADLQKSA